MIISALWRDGGFSGELLNIKKDGAHFWSHAEVSAFEHPRSAGRSGSRCRETSPSASSVRRPTGGCERLSSRRATRSSARPPTASSRRGIPAPNASTAIRPRRWWDSRSTASSPPGRTLDDVLATVQAGESYRTEAQRRRSDGSLVWVSIAVSPVRDRRGVVVGCSGIHSDITERRRAAEELSKREAQLADAQRVAHIGSWEWDIASDEIQLVRRALPNPRIGAGRIRGELRVLPRGDSSGRP